MWHAKLAGSLAFVVLTVGCQCAQSGMPLDSGRDAQEVLDTRLDVAVQPAEPVRVVITADNSYAFGWGDDGRVNTLRGRPMSAMCGQYICASDIFECPIGTGAAGAGPEEYVVPASEAADTGYLYIVAWEDGVGTQGVIGQFERAGQRLGTGTADWQVCATGRRFRSDNPSEASGPDAALVNQEIARCNAGTGDAATTSRGWVGVNGPISSSAVGWLRIGEDNSTAHDIGAPIVGDNAFPVVCQGDTDDAGVMRRGVPASTRWMWYAAFENDTAFVYPQSGSENHSRQFLIFRLPIAALIP